MQNRHFHVVHEVVRRWQRKVKSGLTRVQSCWFAYYTSSNFDILIAVALLDLKVPISLKPDWIQLCIIVGD